MKSAITRNLVTEHGQCAQLHGYQKQTAAMQHELPRPWARVQQNPLITEGRSKAALDEALTRQRNMQLVNLRTCDSLFSAAFGSYVLTGAQCTEPAASPGQ